MLFYFVLPLSALTCQMRINNKWWHVCLQLYIIPFKLINSMAKWFSQTLPIWEDFKRTRVFHIVIAQLEQNHSKKKYPKIGSIGKTCKTVANYFILSFILFMMRLFPSQTEADNLSEESQRGEVKPIFCYSLSYLLSLLFLPEHQWLGLGVDTNLHCWPLLESHSYTLSFVLFSW